MSEHYICDRCGKTADIRIDEFNIRGKDLCKNCQKLLKVWLKNE